MDSPQCCVNGFSVPRKTSIDIMAVAWGRNTEYIGSSLSHMGRKQERKSDDKQQAVSQPVAPVEPAPEAAPASARPKPRPADSTDFAADIASRLVSRYVANVDKIERKDDFWEE